MWNIRKIVSKGDYTYAVVPEHPHANEHGYVLEHRIVMENHLKRLLSDNEVVHHIDKNKKNNNIKNLEVRGRKEHSKYHGLKQGRAFVDLICPNCGKLFSIPKNQSFIQKGSEYTCCSRSCRGKFSRYMQLNGRTHKVEKAISGNLVKEYKYYHDNPEETD